MKTLFSIGLFAACVMVSACSDTDGATFNPIAPELSAAASGDLRITAPTSGSVMGAERAFSVQATQQIHGGPLQGNARLETSANGLTWSLLGSEFAWSAQDAVIATPSVSLSGHGAVQLRIIVYDVAPEAPFLESDAVTVHCLGQIQTRLADAGR